MRRVLLLVVFLLFSSPSFSAPSLEDVLDYSNGDEGLTEAKIEALRSTGARIGAQIGLLERAKEIAAFLNEKGTLLDQIFAFQPLLTEEGLLPPVITEIDQTVETRNEAQRIEFAGKVYKILAPARFVRISPTWRDYLFNGLDVDKMSVDRLPESLKPSTGKEKAIWKEAVYLGWETGRRQADSIFMENVARLKRDYVGMVKYYSLFKRGMVKKPVIAKTRPHVEVSDDEIAIGVGISEIQKKATMESDQSAWEARIN